MLSQDGMGEARRAVFALRVIAHDARGEYAGIGDISVPRQISPACRLPLPGSGKIDYGAVRDLAKGLAAGEAGA